MLAIAPWSGDGSKLMQLATQPICGLEAKEFFVRFKAWDDGYRNYALTFMYIATVTRSVQFSLWLRKTVSN